LPAHSNKTDSLSRTTGSHHIYGHPDGRTIPVPYSNPSDGFAIGTLRRMIELAKWTEDDWLTALSVCAWNPVTVNVDEHNFEAKLHHDVLMERSPFTCSIRASSARLNSCWIRILRLHPTLEVLLQGVRRAHIFLLVRTCE
jgi:hypothetical protein